MFGAKNRALIAKLNVLSQACDDSQASFGEALECPVSVRAMDRAGSTKWEESWSSQRTPPEGGWDWPVISEGSKSKPDEFCVAIWHEDTTLCGVFDLLIRGNSVQVLAVEGNPDDNHPLIGRRRPARLTSGGRLPTRIGR